MTSLITNLFETSIFDNILSRQSRVVTPGDVFDATPLVNDESLIAVHEPGEVLEPD
jgi:hypothetical protein